MGKVARQHYLLTTHHQDLLFSCPDPGLDTFGKMGDLLDMQRAAGCGNSWGT